MLCCTLHVNDVIGIIVVLRHFKKYFSYIVAVSL